MPLLLPRRLGHPRVDAQEIWGSEKPKGKEQAQGEAPRPSTGFPGLGNRAWKCFCVSGSWKQGRYRHTFRHISRDRLGKELGLPAGSGGGESACNARAWGLVLLSGRSPGEGNGNPLQYSCLENPMGRGAWWATSMGSQRVGHDFHFSDRDINADAGVNIDWSFCCSVAQSCLTFVAPRTAAHQVSVRQQLPEIDRYR